MDSNRIPNNLLNYSSHGKRSVGRPLKRWSATVTGHLGLILDEGGEEEEEEEEEDEDDLFNDVLISFE
jgi:hypothetical protein